MSGVTHFEVRSRRGRKDHPACPFCGAKVQVTPQRVFRKGGAEKFINWWAEHVFECIPCTAPNGENIKVALRHMAAFGGIVWWSV